MSMSRDREWVKNGEDMMCWLVHGIGIKREDAAKGVGWASFGFRLMNHSPAPPDRMTLSPALLVDDQICSADLHFLPIFSSLPLLPFGAKGIKGLYLSEYSNYPSSSAPVLVIVLRKSRQQQRQSSEVCFNKHLKHLNDATKWLRSNLLKRQNVTSFPNRYAYRAKTSCSGKTSHH